MKMILIGHRGVGKTSLLQRILIYNAMTDSEIPLFDLDREIEKVSQKSVAEVFEFVGEANFRKMEKSLFNQLTRFKNYVISVGAGFQIAEANLPTDVQVVWIRRKSDSHGRVFLNRPRLDKAVRPLDEYLERFQEREQSYQTHSHWIYEIPEGLSSPTDFERQIFKNSLSKIEGGLTVLPHHAKNFESFKERQWRWDFSFFELRDDLLSEGDIEKFLAILPKNQVLLSFRSKTPSVAMLAAAVDGYRTDRSIELDENILERWPRAKADIISVHDRGAAETVNDVIQRLEASSISDQHLKLAIEICNFEELEQGLKWQTENPHMRSFLPRSKNGRWAWVRLWLKGRQILNFVREGSGSALDQPSLFEWALTPKHAAKFAAVLGHPVWQSYSPNEHRDFFEERGMPFFTIDIMETEWEMAMSVLEKMGVAACAVTSPLKKHALAFVKSSATALAKELHSANTLVRNPEGWFADNTDLEGFSSLLESAGGVDGQNPTIIWGGGGTLNMIKKLLPEAAHFSSRSSHANLPKNKIKTLIWAASPGADLPPAQWAPDLVIDLNYRDDSLAKEYCQITGARYMSGLEMFYSQAQTQQKFWEKYL